MRDGSRDLVACSHDSLNRGARYYRIEVRYHFAESVQYLVVDSTRLKDMRSQREWKRQKIHVGGYDTGVIISELIAPDSTTDANELASIIQQLLENTMLGKVFSDGSL